MDLGMSSMQIDTFERGFSYAYDAPLDMRMDPDQELTAAEVIGTWEERRLARLFRDYGEERFANQIARAIVRARSRQPLARTQELVEVIKSAVPIPAQFAAGHPAKRVFQAIRIAVNDELAQLDAALPLAWELLQTGGRLAVISFQSLEDRRVKRFLAGLARGCICPPEFPVCVCGHEPEAELLTRRAIAPSPGEVADNPRSKSAHLRAARKLEESNR
jgi:16S rRNA (cytosine1402-N4)-methyltransferase